MDSSRFIRIPLKKGEVFKLARPKGCVIRTVSGGLWITQANQTEDTFINQGGVFVAKEEGVLLAEAMESTLMSITYQPAPSVRPQSILAAVAATLQGA
ncbi:MAG: DUF2917 domain-containing protein [Collimonas sp.]|uniref:DUF2917 domain-containing protein n=1 Tax=Collimonas sp. TaxID=1963772 RepID=UPI003263F210